MNKIVVLLATYNGEDFIQEQLDSLLKQSVDFDILIRDDGSRDKTIKVIERFIYENENIKLISDKENSTSAKENFSILLNYALSLNKYEYFMFCDQDDIWKKDKVLKTFEKLKEIEQNYQSIPILIHSNLEVVDENLNLISKSYWDYQKIDPNEYTLNTLLVQNIITGNTVMINKLCAKISNKIPKNAIMHDWWIGMVASVFGKIYYLEESTILYRQHQNNDTGALKFNFINVFKKIFQFKNINVKKYLIQAELFLKIYEKQLDDEKKEMLNSFVEISKYPFYKRWYILYKYRIFKNKITRNIGLFIKV